MRKVELSIAYEYVPSWTVSDAIRELFQNALDQEIQSPENKMSWSYENDTLIICNKHSSLTMQSLLLGCSTKRDDKATIGQFGEGYKIAALVLLRNEQPITIYNYAEREIWRPRFVDSKRFGTKILTFFIEKVAIWDKVPDNDLTIEVSNISEFEWQNEIVPLNLHLQDPYRVEEYNEYGEALIEEQHKGMVFVNGLYVCKYEPYKYGYNFKPGYLKLDRDRKLASDFDLKWLASRFWLDNPKAIELIAEGVDDVAYIYHMSYSMAEQVYEHFRLVHGPHAVPVTNQFELDNVPAGYKGILISENYQRLIKRSFEYEEPEDNSLSPQERLWDWYNSIKQVLTDDACEEFESIFNKL